MAESVFTYMAAEAGLSDRFEIDSAATTREELGNTPHYGTVRKLREVGIPLVPHRARLMTRQDYLYYDYILGMDRENIRHMHRICGGDPEGKIYKLLDFAGIDRDMADPWYTGNFDATYRDVSIGCKAFLEYLSQEELL